eukprot:TRINITY_DN9735_c0_g1_i1.p1 TRINITY_DN9735_c0_g1~~TRINITY_DN9735_c0_g1_i1.p1  ORF type:complete len:800 (+),score=199.12 TRINITY_DN9735_c0_g1_i1:199-2598(+)
MASESAAATPGAEIASDDSSTDVSSSQIYFDPSFETKPAKHSNARAGTSLNMRASDLHLSNDELIAVMSKVRDGDMSIDEAIAEVTSVELSKHQPVQREVDSTAVNLSDDQQSYMATLSNSTRLAVLKRMTKGQIFDDAVSDALTSQADSAYDQDLRAHSPNPGQRTSSSGSLGSRASSLDSSESRFSRAKAMSLFKRRKSSGGESAEKTIKRRVTLFGNRRHSNASRQSNSSLRSVESSPKTSPMTTRQASAASVTNQSAASPARPMMVVAEEPKASKPKRVVKPEEVLFRAKVIKEVKVGAYDGDALDVDVGAVVNVLSQQGAEWECEYNGDVGVLKFIYLRRLTTEDELSTSQTSSHAGVAEGQHAESPDKTRKTDGDVAADNRHSVTIGDNSVSYKPDQDHTDDDLDMYDNSDDNDSDEEVAPSSQDEPDLAIESTQPAEASADGATDTAARQPAELSSDKVSGDAADADNSDPDPIEHGASDAHRGGQDEMANVETHSSPEELTPLDADVEAGAESTIDEATVPSTSETLGAEVDRAAEGHAVAEDDVPTEDDKLADPVPLDDDDMYDSDETEDAAASHAETADKDGSAPTNEAAADADPAASMEDMYASDSSSEADTNHVMLDKEGDVSNTASVAETTRTESGKQEPECAAEQRESNAVGQDEDDLYDSDDSDGNNAAEEEPSVAAGNGHERPLCDEQDTADTTSDQTVAALKQTYSVQGEADAKPPAITKRKPSPVAPKPKPSASAPKIAASKPETSPKSSRSSVSSGKAPPAVAAKPTKAVPPPVKRKPTA